jgi:glucokinase
MLTVKADGQQILGLDFGGTKLAAGVVDLLTGRMIDSGTAPTRPDGGASGAISDLAAMAGKLDGIEMIDGIGVCFGGHVQQGMIQRSLHIMGWENFPLSEHLVSHFGQKDVQIANDANAIALGEWRFGAGRGSCTMIYTTVSTGIGGGIILDRQLYQGATGMAGEIGHMKVMPGGPLCTCGQKGCLEAVAAGPAIVRNAQGKRRAHPLTSSNLPEAGELSVEDIAHFAEGGDELAKQVLHEAGHYLGIGIANMINLLDPERVVIGGGVSRAGDIWWEAVTETVKNDILPRSASVDIRLAELDQYGGVWGAAALFM